ncbi:hypothetical protein Hanom_Chr16g01494171 [Helianthus anomalus]
MMCQAIIFFIIQNAYVDNYIKSKLQNSSFIFTPDCKLCPLSLKSTKTILDVCKVLHVMSFSPNSISFHG